MGYGKLFARTTMFICAVVAYVRVDEALNESNKIEFLDYIVRNGIVSARAALSVVIPLSLILFLHYAFVYFTKSFSYRKQLLKMSGVEFESLERSVPESKPQPKYEVYISQVVLQVLTEGLGMGVALNYSAQAMFGLDGRYDDWSDEYNSAKDTISLLQGSISASIPYVVGLAYVLMDDFSQFVQLVQLCSQKTEL